MRSAKLGYPLSNSGCGMRKWLISYLNLLSGDHYIGRPLSRTSFFRVWEAIFMNIHVSQEPKKMRTVIWKKSATSFGCAPSFSMFEPLPAHIRPYPALSGPYPALSGPIGPYPASSALTRPPQNQIPFSGPHEIWYVQVSPSESERVPVTLSTHCLGSVAVSGGLESDSSPRATRGTPKTIPTPAWSGPGPPRAFHKTPQLPHGTESQEKDFRLLATIYYISISIGVSGMAWAPKG